ncbi:MAG: DUF418 domain-containing protein [Planctomycetota bacterium]
MSETPEPAAPDSAETLAAAPAAGPLTLRERVGALDAVRGFALLGICIVNLPQFGRPVMEEPPLAGADQVVMAGVSALAISRLFPLFACLYGYGIAVQVRRADERPDRGALGPRFARRSVGLFVLGALHAVFLFFGDILAFYALLALPLWIARRWTPKTLAILAGVVLFLTAGFYLLLGLIYGAAATGMIDGGMPPPDAAAATLEVESSGYAGSFMEATRQRIGDLPFAAFLVLLLNGPVSLAAGLLGLAGGQLRLFERFSERRRRCWQVAAWLTPVVLLGGALGGAAMAYMREVPFWITGLGFGLSPFAGPALGAIYALLVTEIAESRRSLASVLSAPLRVAGRVSLSHYVGQSAMAGFVFGGWGLGYFGELGVAVCLPLALLHWCLLTALAALWLRFFRLGPLEWLLRSLTYGRPMPLLR